MAAFAMDFAGGGTSTTSIGFCRKLRLLGPASVGQYCARSSGSVIRAISGPSECTPRCTGRSGDQRVVTCTFTWLPRTDHEPAPNAEPADAAAVEAEPAPPPQVNHGRDAVGTNLLRYLTGATLVSALAALDAGLAWVGHKRGWTRPVAWLGPTFAGLGAVLFVVAGHHESRPGQ